MVAVHSACGRREVAVIAVWSPSCLTGRRTVAKHSLAVWSPCDRRVVSVWSIQSQYSRSVIIASALRVVRPQCEQCECTSIELRPHRDRVDFYLTM